MRKGFTFVEIILVIVITPFVFLLIDGLFKAFISEIPWTNRIIQENTNMLGMLAQNIWSFAGPNEAPDVDKFTFQYFINYNLPAGWYLTSTPTITADWEKSSDQRWTVPFGGGAGKLARFGNQPVDFKLQAFGNLEKPDGGPEWSLQFSVKFLFPK